MSPLLPLALLLAALLPCAAEEEAGAPPCPPPPGAEFPPRGHAVPPPPHDFRPPSREQVAMRMMVRKLLLDRYDANHDHHLDGEERHRLMADAHAARKQQALAFIHRFDADGDGKLSPAEHDAMRQAMKERQHPEVTEPHPEPPPPPHHRAKRHAPHEHHPTHRPRMGREGRLVAIMVRQLTMEAYDTDNNGQLNREESERLREDGDWLYQTREAALLAQYDSNRDGLLSDSERQVALEELFPLPAFPPPPPHPERGGHKRGHGAINRLLDTHFDIDILMNLTRQPQSGNAPQAQAAPTAPSPCSPSTPSAN